MLDGKNLIFIAIGVGILGGLAYFALRRTEAETHNQGTQAAINELKDMPQSYPDVDYEEMANVLFNAMDTMFKWLIDVDAIFRVIYKIHNAKDWYLLDKAFGIKDNGNLAAWLANNLDVSNIAKINAELKKHGISKKV